MSETTADEEAIRLELSECVAAKTIAHNPIRQILIKGQTAEISRSADGTEWVSGTSGARWRVYFAGQSYQGWELSVRCPIRRSKLPTEEVPTCTWLGGRELALPADVRSSYAGAFKYTEESPETGRRGLRVSQLGAIHAVLGHWTTGSSEPVTIVMPTGTGKTEAMVGLLVAAQIERLLVIVPSDALRTQIARKFESLGILQEFGVVGAESTCPVVGQLLHGLPDLTAASELAQACNVVVTTPPALNASGPEVRSAFLDLFSHLFVDEAHHVPASTWKLIRDEFEGRPVVQFTATPYREDGRHMGGRMLYSFPLREAQRLGLFARIRYVSVLDFADPDRAVATTAISQLRKDLDESLDHLLMARVQRKSRAEELVELYRELAPDLNPVVIHSSIGVRARQEALTAIDERTSRIIVCVDMLGEGFDLPALKVAAIHDPHKSLGITLQFVGRFTRVFDETIGEATAVVARPEPDYDPNLRRLYAEDTDWNEVLQDLSEMAVGEQQDISDFESAFVNLPDEVAFRNLAPKMSTVVYRTTCADWNPDGILDIYPEDDLLTYPVPINAKDHVAWFVTKNIQAVRWGDLQTVEEVSYDLFVIYWDSARQLLYINSSDTGSIYEALAAAVGGEGAEILHGENVYRVMAKLTRLVPTNVGVLDYRNRSRRFSMHVGADVIEGFPITEAQTKTKTNIFANGYDNGVRVGVGASLKGRVWCLQVAPTVKHWVDWCDHVGGMLTDESISVDEVMRNFIRPKVLEARPDAVAIALEWPWQIYLTRTDDLRLQVGDKAWPIIDCDLRIASYTDAGDIPFDIVTPSWTARYSVHFGSSGLVYSCDESEEVQVVTSRTEGLTLSSYLAKYGLTILFEDDATVVSPGILLKPDRDVEPYDRDLLTPLDWTGVDHRKESQGSDKAADSVQARVIRELVDSENWDIVLDDDGTGEIADIVALRLTDTEFHVTLVHCKFSSGDAPGARVADLYEVCGQAQKCSRWRDDPRIMFQHLRRRERRRLERGTRSGFEVGTMEALYDIEDRARFLKPQFRVAVAQPGLSKTNASDSQLRLLACTQMYLFETATSNFTVYCSP